MVYVSETGSQYQFWCISEVSKKVNVLLLLGAKVLKAREGTYKFKLRKGRKNLVEMGGN